MATSPRMVLPRQRRQQRANAQRIAKLAALAAFGLTLLTPASGSACSEDPPKGFFAVKERLEQESYAYCSSQKGWYRQKLCNAVDGWAHWFTKGVVEGKSAKGKGRMRAPTDAYFAKGVVSLARMTQHPTQDVSAEAYRLRVYRIDICKAKLSLSAKRYVLASSQGGSIRRIIVSVHKGKVQQSDKTFPALLLRAQNAAMAKRVLKRYQTLQKHFCAKG